MSEREQLTNILMDSVGHAEEYVSQRWEVERATIRNSEEGSFGIERPPDRSRALAQLDEYSPATKAAFVMAAVAYQAFTFTGEYELKEFAEIWRPTNFAHLARYSQRLAEAIGPQLRGRFTTVDLAAMHDSFDMQIKEADREEVIITGLNASGKSTVIESAVNFIKYCGLSTKTIKFPRTESGPFGSFNKSVLDGDTQIEASAFQFMCLADALDHVVSDADVTFLDRHPKIEAVVYGPEKIETAILATHELFYQRPSWIFMIDRHPEMALRAVENREREGRIFERRVEQMVNQLVKYAALAKLPGFRWINNDIPTGTKKSPVELSSSRVILTLITSGVIPRAMVRQGLAGDEKSARKIVGDIYVTKQKRLLTP